MNNTSSSLNYIKNMVIATSLTTVVLSSFVYETTSPLEEIRSVNYQPLQIDPIWDISSLKAYTQRQDLVIDQDQYHAQELLAFANLLTKEMIVIDPEIRDSIEKNFWDMI